MRCIARGAVENGRPRRGAAGTGGVGDGYRTGEMRAHLSGPSRDDGACRARGSFGRGREYAEGRPGASRFRNCQAPQDAEAAPRQARAPERVAARDDRGRAAARRNSCLLERISRRARQPLQSSCLGIASAQLWRLDSAGSRLLAHDPRQIRLRLHGLRLQYPDEQHAESFRAVVAPRS